MCLYHMLIIYDMVSQYTRSPVYNFSGGIGIKPNGSLFVNNRSVFFCLIFSRTRYIIAAIDVQVFVKCLVQSIRYVSMIPSAEMSRGELYNLFTINICDSYSIPSIIPISVFIPVQCPFAFRSQFWLNTGVKKCMK